MLFNFFQDTQSFATDQRGNRRARVVTDDDDELPANHSGCRVSIV